MVNENPEVSGSLVDEPTFPVDEASEHPSADTTVLPKIENAEAAEAERRATFLANMQISQQIQNQADELNLVHADAVESVTPLEPENPAPIEFPPLPETPSIPLSPEISNPEFPIPPHTLEIKPNEAE